MSTKGNRLRGGAAAILVSTFAVAAQAQQIGMETASANSVVGIMPQTMAGHWAKDGVKVQLSMDQTLTKSLLKVAQGQLDAAVVPPPAFVSLAGGTGPYAQLGEKAKALAPNVRTLFGFPASYYHAIVWADSGFKTWADLKGKRVYIGPPAGAANAQIAAMVSAGGLAEGEYTAIKAPWGGATQSFQDGQFDAYVGSFGLGSQSVAELSMSRSIRLLAVSAEHEVPPEGLGMAKATIPAGTYPGQKNETDTHTWQTVMMLVVRKDLPDDIAYMLTKSYFSRVKDIAASNALLAHLPAGDPMGGVTAPLHPGAVRYFNEAGISIPAALTPQ